MLEYEIHPAIGIARVGSSRLSSDEGFFFGPEPGGSPPASYRDSAGNLKRQAVRFRVFACRRDEKQRLLEAAELTLNATRSITWTVHLVNRKGTARRQYQSGPGFRNGPTQEDVADRDLIIDPGPRTVSLPGERRKFDTGRFRSTTVPLGEIVMEPAGCLRVLGGFGRSGSDPPQPRLNSNNGHRADNRNWFDDISDGPVSVRIELRIVYDRLIGLVGFIPAADLNGDRRTLVEAIECGWWYSAPLPDGQHVTALMTDADLLPLGQAARTAFWRDQLQQAPHIEARVGHSAISPITRVASACSSRSPTVAANDWVAVGDAAAAFDPLSSHGVSWALESGLMAAEAIDRRLCGHPKALTHLQTAGAGSIPPTAISR